MTKIYDISVTLSADVPVWPGDAKPSFERIMRIEEGDVANVTHIDMSAHTGTHIDAPRHFLPDGNGVDRLLLDVLIGDAQVIELRENHHVTAEDLCHANIGEKTERLLIKTTNSKMWNTATFQEDYIGISAEGAEYLVERGIKLVGVDYLSVAPFNEIVSTHEILLKEEVVIVEGLNLSNVESGVYELYCLPLKIAGADGAPARAILVQK